MRKKKKNMSMMTTMMTMMVMMTMIPWDGGTQLGFCCCWFICCLWPEAFRCWFPKCIFAKSSRFTHLLCIFASLLLPVPNMWSFYASHLVAAQNMRFKHINMSILISKLMSRTNKWGTCPDLMTLPAEDLQPARYYIPPSLPHQSFILVLNHLLSQTQSHSQFSTDRTSPFGSSENLQLLCICFFIPSSWLYILFSFTLRENLTWIYSAP